MGRRLVIVLIACCASLAVVAPSSSGQQAACGTSHAASCAKCKLKLTGSAFGDSNASALGIGTTVNQTATVKIALKGCKLPKGAHVELSRQRVGPTGRRTGPIKILSCAGRGGCIYTFNSATATTFDYQARIVGCKGAKKSSVLTVVWAPKSTTGGGGTTTPTPTPTPAATPTPGATLTPKLVDAKRDGGIDPACSGTFPAPGVTSGTAVYTEPRGLWKVRYEWAVPSAVTSGSSGRVAVTVLDNMTGGTLSAEAHIKAPSDFGMNPFQGNAAATAPMGGSSPTGNAPVSFTPPRAFAAGEPSHYIRIELGDCGAYDNRYEIQ